MREMAGENDIRLKQHKLILVTLEYSCLTSFSRNVVPYFWLVENATIKTNEYTKENVRVVFVNQKKNTYYK